MYHVTCEKSYEMQLEMPPFSERYAALRRHDGKKKVVYIKNEFDNSTFRYRCYNFGQALRDSAEFVVTAFLCDEIAQVLPHADDISILVLQRTLWTPEVQSLLNFANRRRIPVVFDMDDLYYRPDFIPTFLNHVHNTVRQFNQREFLAHIGWATSYDLVARQCRLFLTTTEYLADRLRQDYGAEVFVIPNFMNHEQLAESEAVLQTRRERPERFQIGYFSGTPSHARDFAVAADGIARLMREHKDVDLKIVGFMELPASLRDFHRQGRIITRKLVPYQALPYEIGTADLNLIPLTPICFNDAKSELKFFEAGAVRVASCLSPSDVYRRCAVDGEDCLYCTPDGWYRALERLYSDKPLRDRLAQAAYEKSLRRYTPEANAAAIEATYRAVLDRA